MCINHAVCFLHLTYDRVYEINMQCPRCNFKSTARQLHYQCIELSTTGNATYICTQVNKINLTLLQYRTAVVGAETLFRALQPQRS